MVKRICLWKGPNGERVVENTVDQLAIREKAAYLVALTFIEQGLLRDVPLVAALPLYRFDLPHRNLMIVYAVEHSNVAVVLDIVRLPSAGGTPSADVVRDLIGRLSLWRARRWSEDDYCP